MTGTPREVIELSGEVVRISEREGRREVTVALHTHQVFRQLLEDEDAHLGDRVWLRARISGVRVVPELPEPSVSPAVGRGKKARRGSHRQRGEEEP